MLHNMVIYVAVVQYLYR